MAEYIILAYLKIFDAESTKVSGLPKILFALTLKCAICIAMLLVFDMNYKLHSQLFFFTNKC